MYDLASLPEHVLRQVESGAIAKFVTMSAAGVPVDTPTCYFPSDDLATLDVATGLAYPVKADLARRNPRVSMLPAASAVGDPIGARVMLSTPPVHQHWLGLAATLTTAAQVKKLTIT